jgi:hypothetical protein
MDKQNDESENAVRAIGYAESANDEMLGKALRTAIANRVDATLAPPLLATILPPTIV